MDASLKKKKGGGGGKKGNCRCVEAGNILPGLSVFVIPIIGQNCVHTLPHFKAVLKASVTRLLTKGLKDCIDSKAQWSSNSFLISEMYGWSFPCATSMIAIAYEKKKLFTQLIPI